MTRCAVVFNRTGDGGDGTEFGTSSGSGAGLSLAGSATITDSTISENRVGNGGSAQNNSSPHGSGGAGGGIMNSVSTTITGSTINNNASGNGADVPPGMIGTAGGGGKGGGISHGGETPGSALSLINCTISGNSAGHGGVGGVQANQGFSDGGNGGGISTNGPHIRLSSCTVVLNSAGLTGDRSDGEDGKGGGLSGNAQITNSIVALNITRDISNRDLFGSYSSSGYNIIGIHDVGTCCFNSTDQLGSTQAPLNPVIGALAANGGPTQTHALLSGSPALDKGIARDLDFQLTTTDQRGFPRPFDNPAIPPALDGDNSDIGAFERQSSDPITTIVHFSSALFEITEGCVQLDVTVKRTGPIVGTTEVTYVTSNRLATQRGDFTYASGRIIFAPGEDTKTIPVLISRDAYAERIEDLDVTLVEVTGGMLGSPSSARLYINDNEPRRYGQSD